MKKEFWLERWERNETGFHEGVPNGYLSKFWRELKVESGSLVFVPLCGKSVDLLWIQEQGCDVVGVEISELAVQAFFKESNLIPDVEILGKFKRYSTKNITILCGDFFDLSRENLLGVKMVYDRASMVALPPEMRKRYVQHLVTILPAGERIMLIAFDYDQSLMEGPPFAISPEEVEGLYSDKANINLLEKIDSLEQNLRFKQRGLTRLEESVYLMTLR